MGIDLSRGGRKERGMGAGGAGRMMRGRREEEMRTGKRGRREGEEEDGGAGAEILLWNWTQSLELKWVQNQIGGRNSIFSQA